MGVYCFVCSAKNGELYVPKTCNCLVERRREKTILVKYFKDKLNIIPEQSYFEGFCPLCWSNLFRNEYKEVDWVDFSKPPYNLPIEKIEELKQYKLPTLFQQQQQHEVKCPYCEKKMKEKSRRDYDDDFYTDEDETDSEECHTKKLKLTEEK
jgi:hypothetical protein